MIRSFCFCVHQLSHNIKNVVLRPSGVRQSRLMLTLQDNSFLSIDKVPSKDAEEMRLFLDAVHQNRLNAGEHQLSQGLTLAVIKNITGLQTSILDEYLCKNPHQNISRPNSTAC